MSDKRLRLVAAAALVIGAVLGVAGSFAPTARLRGIAWGIDGTALVIGSALLAMHYVRREDELLGSAFLVFLAGETLVLSGSAMELSAGAQLFAAGAALWSAALVLSSVSSALPWLLRTTAGIAAVLFAATAVEIFGGETLTSLSQPLPFFAYPFLAMTLIGWGWTHVRYDPNGARA